MCSVQENNNAAVICVSRILIETTLLHGSQVAGKRVFDALSDYSEVAIRDGFLDVHLPALEPNLHHTSVINPAMPKERRGRLNRWPAPMEGGR